MKLFSFKQPLYISIIMCSFIACQSLTSSSGKNNTEISVWDGSMKSRIINIPMLKVNSPCIESYLKTYSGEYSELSEWRPLGYTPYIMAEIVRTDTDTTVNFITQGCVNQGMIEYLDAVENKSGNILRGGFITENILFLLTSPSQENPDYFFLTTEDHIQITISKLNNSDMITKNLPIVFFEIIDIDDESLRDKDRQD